MLLLCSLALSSQPQARGKLIVRVEGIETSQGNVMIALYNKAEDFNSTDKVYQGKTSPARAGSLLFVFDEIPPGEYAVSCLHDKNSNGKMDLNFLGIPREKFGFSNNKMGTAGPPSFEQSKVRVEAGKTISISIQLRNLI